MRTKTQMQISSSIIAEIFIGQPCAYGPNGEASAIQKQSIDHPVQVTTLGLHGDEQGDKLYHGGPDKAVHHYPAEHYALWRAQLGPDAASTFQPGGFGENISTTGWTEHIVCIGDVFAMGTALLQVTQARQPCWKLNLRFNHHHMASMVQNSLRTGWYYRVLQAGMAAPGDSLRLLDRMSPQWPLARLLHYLYIDTMNLPALQAMAELDALTPSWRKLAQDRLERGRLEDWSRRLSTPVVAYAVEAAASSTQF